MQVYGIDAVVRILSHFIFIFLAFRAINAINLETWFKKEFQNSSAIRLFLTFLSIAIGFSVSSFFLEFLNLTRNLLISFQ